MVGGGLDLQQHNLGLNSAWKRAQDRSKWRNYSWRRLCPVRDAPPNDDDDDDPFYLKFWVNRPPLKRNRRIEQIIARSPSALIHHIRETFSSLSSVFTKLLSRPMWNLEYNVNVLYAVRVLFPCVLMLFSFIVVFSVFSIFCQLQCNVASKSICKFS